MRQSTLESRAVQAILIVGAGGHGSEVCAYIAELGDEADGRLLGLIDNGRAPGPWLETEILGGLPQLDALATKFAQSTLCYITAVGENPTRSRIVRAIEGFGHRTLRAWTLQHPTASVGSDVHIGNGTLLAPYVIITTR